MSALRRLVAANRRACNRLAARYPGFFGYPSYHDELRARVERDLEKGLGPVLEAGGIDRPMLARDAGYRYDGLDIEEKPSCHEIYDRFFVQSIEDPIPERYGVILSMTLLEHVPDNAAAARQIHDALLPGGATHHYVPSKGHPYALILRLVGPRWQKRLIGALRTAESAAITGYPTFFDHCSVRQMARLLREAGFEDVDLRCFYRANDYFAFLVPAFVLATAFENLCRALGWSYFASGFVISGRKPQET